MFLTGRNRPSHGSVVARRNAGTVSAAFKQMSLCGCVYVCGHPSIHLLPAYTVRGPRGAVHPRQHRAQGRGTLHLDHMGLFVLHLRSLNMYRVCACQCVWFVWTWILYTDLVSKGVPSEDLYIQPKASCNPGQNVFQRSARLDPGQQPPHLTSPESDTCLYSPMLLHCLPPLPCQ